MKPFSIFNTLTRRVERLEPLHPPTVTLYSCGPTVYLPQHLGNMRAYLFVDTLKRALRFHGYDVRHVMNITDVGHMTSDEDAGEDKVEKTARAEGKSPKEVADFYIAQFKRDCAALNIELPPDADSGNKVSLPNRSSPFASRPFASRPFLPPDAASPPQSALCRATDNIDAMITLIERIIAHGYAYKTPSGVYFDVEKWRGASRVGRLSRQSLDEQHAGQRLEHSPDKQSPHDFALWVLNQPGHLMQWESPWGRGYPGWHIECSAMSMKYLGETLDIHTGGLDHIPIHHENEIAQSESATGHPFARYFVHNAFLVGMEGAKISKSAGKFPLVEDLRSEGIDPLAFRLFCFGAKYRSELAFSIRALSDAEINLEYLDQFAVDAKQASVDAEDSDWATKYLERFGEALSNDLNTPQALAIVFELARDARGRDDLRVWRALRRLDQVLGLGLESRVIERESEQRAIGLVYIENLLHERERARAARDFALADRLRAQIESQGYEVRDTAGGRPVLIPKRR